MNTNEQEIDPGEGFRLLGALEILQEGDEFHFEVNPNDGSDWFPVLEKGIPVRDKPNPIRRQLPAILNQAGEVVLVQTFVDAVALIQCERVKLLHDRDFKTMQGADRERYLLQLGRFVEDKLAAVGEVEGSGRPLEC